jgi:hypothetical protein
MLMSLLAAVMAACSTRPTPPADVSASLWIPFKWQSAIIGEHSIRRATLLVPVDIAGRHAFLQLDTGSGWPMWYGVPLKQLNGTASHSDSLPDELVLAARLGSAAHGYSITADTFLVRKGFGDRITASTPTPVIGTLGVRFFRHRTLVIDFPHQRLAIVDSGDTLPDGLARRATFVPTAYEHGYVFVPMTINGLAFSDFFYDTGASLFPITTTAATWHTLTNRSERERGNTVWRVSSWGTMIDEVGAPALGDVRIGTFRDQHPLVFHEAAGSPHPDFFASVPYHVGGTFGNALFYDRNIVIIDLPHQRFGIAESPEVAPSTRR